MNLTLHLTEETAARLKEQASLAGKSPEDLALEALQEKLADDDAGVTLSPATRLAEFHAWLASMPGGNPAADFCRESIYGTRGE